MANKSEKKRLVDLIRKPFNILWYALDAAEGTTKLMRDVVVVADVKLREFDINDLDFSEIEEEKPKKVKKTKKTKKTKAG